MPYANATRARRVGYKPNRSHRLPMAPNQTIYEGSICTFNSAGQVVFGTVGANLGFAGVALETKTTGPGQTDYILVGDGVFNFAKASATQSDVGKEAYLDSGTTGNPQQVTLTDPGSFSLKVGRVLAVRDSGSVDVETTGYAWVTQCKAT